VTRALAGGRAGSRVRNQAALTPRQQTDLAHTASRRPHCTPFSINMATRSPFGTLLPSSLDAHTLRPWLFSRFIFTSPPPPSSLKSALPLTLPHALLSRKPTPPYLNSGYLAFLRQASSLGHSIGRTTWCLIVMASFIGRFGGISPRLSSPSALWSYS